MGNLTTIMVKSRRMCFDQIKMIQIRSSQGHKMIVVVVSLDNEAVVVMF